MTQEEAQAEAAEIIGNPDDLVVLAMSRTNAPQAEPCCFLCTQARDMAFNPRRIASGRSWEEAIQRLRKVPAPRGS